MSNHLAIATVTAALQRTLQAVVQVDIDGARVTTIRPSSIGNGTPETGVNLYLYQVALNPVWRNNADVRGRNRKGETSKRSRTALDLHYMLSFYGNEVELEPQRLLGSVVRILTDRQTLTSTMIRETIADSNFTYLADSDLTEQVEEISFVPMDMSLEDLSKVWSVFFQTTYTLSAAYRATVVLIEGEEAGSKGLPVRDRYFGGVVPFATQPVIDDVISQAGKFEPILADSTLLIRGKNLKSSSTLVLLSGVSVTPLEVSETQIILPLSSLPPASLKAGVQSLQVIQRLAPSNTSGSSNGNPTNGTTATRNATTTSVFDYGIESNVAPFVLRPTIIALSVSNLEGSEDEPRSASLLVQVNLTISPQQRVVLALNEWSIDNPATYLFDAQHRSSDTDSVTVPIRNVKPGEYLVRLHIDGAESQLEIDKDSDSPTFNWYISPKVMIQ